MIIMKINIFITGCLVAAFLLVVVVVGSDDVVVGSDDVVIGSDDVVGASVVTIGLLVPDVAVTSGPEVPSSVVLISISVKLSVVAARFELISL